MKILFAISGLNIGGTERRLVSLINNLCNDPVYEVNLLVLSSNISKSFVDKICIDYSIIDKKNLSNIVVLKKLYNYITNYQPDIVHTWDGYTAFLVGIIKPFAKFKFINSQIASAPNKISLTSRIWFMSRLSFASSDIIISNSKAGINSYRAPVKKCQYIYNGFDFSRLGQSVDATNEQLTSLSSTTITIAMVANFTDYKDQPTLIKAAHLLLKKYQNLVFIFVGEGKTLEKCKLLTSPYNDYFMFLNHSTNVDSLLKYINIGVLSTFNEGISNTIVEYMANKIPVVATNNCGTQELVSNNESGFLVTQNNYNELAAKIELLIKNSDLRRKMGDRGFEIILKKFNLPVMIKQYKEIYISLK